VRSVPESCYQSIVGALHREFVRRADERQARERGDFGRSGLGEAGRRFDAGAHCCATEREAVHTFQGILNPLKIVREQCPYNRPFPDRA